jgi:drug/metabolite transporter (DMT)-like permease
MSWQILLVVNLIFATIREFLYKKISNSIDPYLVVLIINLFVGMWLILVYLLIYKSLPPFLPLVGMGGILYIFSFIYYLKAVAFSLSQSMLFSSYSIIITIILSAVFLGESKYVDITTPLGLKVVLGIILAFVSLWFLLHSGKKKEEKMELKWFWYILITIVCFGVGSFFSLSFLKSITPMEMVINQLYIETPIVVVLCVLFKKKMRIKKAYLKLLFVNSIFITIAMMAFYYALLFVPAAKFYPLQQVALIAITLVLGAVFFKETSIFSGKKLIGMILGFVGMILLVTA